MLAGLGGAGDGPDTDVVDLALSPDDARAWMRTLAAIRLVVASRLGIETEDDHDEDDPRFGVYDWLGYRLDGTPEVIRDGETGYCVAPQQVGDLRVVLDDKDVFGHGVSIAQSGSRRLISAAA